MKIMMEKLFTMAEAAPMMDIDYYTLSRWLNAPRKSDRPRCLRRGRRYVRFTLDHIEEFKRRLDSHSRVILSVKEAKRQARNTRKEAA